MSFRVRNVYKQTYETAVKEDPSENETDEKEEQKLDNEAKRKAILPPSSNGKVSSSIRATQFEKGAEQDSY
jgi:hypothetical protein